MKWYLITLISIMIVFGSVSLVSASYRTFPLYGYNKFAVDGLSTSENLTKLNVNNSQFLQGYVPSDFLLAINEAKLNVNSSVFCTNATYSDDANSSDFWDDLDTPSDISGSEYWYNQTQPSNEYTDEQVANNSFWKNNSGDIYYNEGSVAIGTTDPLMKLHVKDDSGVDVMVLESDDGPALSFNDTGEGETWRINTGGTPSSMFFQYNGDSKVWFDDSGNVGIGSSSPSSKLEIFEDSLTQAEINVSNNDGMGAFRVDNDKLFIYTKETTDLVLSDSKVGIGTASPDYHLDIEDDSTHSTLRLKSAEDAGHSAIFYLEGDDAGWSKIYFGDNNDNDVGRVEYNHADDYMRFLTNTQEVMRIEGDGDIGLGTDAPQSDVHIQADDFLKIVRDTALTTEERTSMRLKLNSTGSASDGFGPAFTFLMEDNSGTETQLGKISGIRDGADNEGAILFSTGTNGNEDVMIMDSSGRVGIGTSSPESVLHTAVSDTTNTFNIDSYDDGTGQARFSFRKSDSDTIGTKAETDDGDILGQILFQGVNSGSTFDNGASIKVTQVGAADSDDVPAKLELITYSTSGVNLNQLVLSQDGNVGIGTNSPNWDLDIEGPNPGIELNDTSAGSAFKMFSNGNEFRLAASDSTIFPEEYFVMDKEGDIGLGVQAPTYRLSIEDDDSRQIEFKHTSATNAWQIGENSGDDFFIRYNSDPFIGILDSGNVGIGTTDPDYQFHVDGGTTGDMILTGQGGQQNLMGVENGAGIFGLWRLSTNDSDASLLIGRSSTGDDDIEIDADGNITLAEGTSGSVGIGTQANSALDPGRLLEIEYSGDGFPAIRFERVSGSTKTNTYWEQFISTDGSYAIRNESNVANFVIRRDGDLEARGNLEVRGNLNVTGCICYDGGATCLGTCL